MDIVIVINVADFWSLMKRQDGVNSVVTMSLKKLKKRRGIDAVHSQKFRAFNGSISWSVGQGKKIHG